MSILDRQRKLSMSSCGTPGSVIALHLHPGAGAFTALIASIQRCLNAGAQTRRPSPFLAFQLWSLLHGMTDLRAGKPEMPWPGPDEMIDNFLVCLGLRLPATPGPDPATRPPRPPAQQAPANDHELLANDFAGVLHGNAGGFWN
jgi:hypothetical protein